MNENKIDRKTFFKESLKAVIDGISSVVNTTIHEKETIKRLRPPGSVEESSFRALCDLCGDCFKACPHGAIIPLDHDGAAKGTPVIIPEETPCYLCDPVVCSHSCPQKAILPTTITKINIGVAIVNENHCFAAQGIDPSCDYCFDRCPFKDVAILFDKGPLIQKDHCNGCGICAYYCVSNPKSIQILPL